VRACSAGTHRVLERPRRADGGLWCKNTTQVLYGYSQGTLSLSTPAVRRSRRKVLGDVASDDPADYPDVEIGEFKVSTPSEYPIRVPHQSTPSEYPIRVPHQSTPSEYPIRVLLIVLL
jgi:hypothetical protein